MKLGLQPPIKDRLSKMQKTLLNVERVKKILKEKKLPKMIHQMPEHLQTRLLTPQEPGWKQ